MEQCFYQKYFKFSKWVNSAGFYLVTKCECDSGGLLLSFGPVARVVSLIRDIYIPVTSGAFSAYKMAIK